MGERMIRAARWAGVFLLGAGIVLCAPSCAGWFSPPGVPTLLIGDVTILDGRGTFVLSAANMPGGGLASLLVDIGGLALDLGKVAYLSVEGLNGFEVLAIKMQGSNCGFVLSHPSGGIEDGEIARLTFTVWRDVSLDDFAFDADRISLGDADNCLIAYELADESTFLATQHRAEESGFDPVR